VSTTTTRETDTVAINTIRGLCMDAIQRANSGHPGTPMGVAPVAYVLWQPFLRFDPSDPIWPNRDRFVLSEGHASALLWSLLHLSGVRAVDPDYEVLGRAAVTLDDLKTFGASPAVSTRLWARSRRSSCHAGTRRWPSRCRRIWQTGLPWRSASTFTAPTGSS
jgi:hypothetical protein